MSLLVGENELREYEKKRQNENMTNRDTALTTWSYVNKYDALYDKYSLDRNFNSNLWESAMKYGEQDFFFTLIEANKGKELSKEFYDEMRDDFDGYEIKMLELSKALMDNTDDTKEERFKTEWDMVNNDWVKVSLGEMNDWEYYDYQIKQSYTYQAEQMKLAEEQRQKEALGWWGQFGHDVLAFFAEAGEGAFSIVTGVLDFVAAVGSLGLIPLAANGGFDENYQFGDAFVKWFGEKGLTAWEQNTVRTALDEYERTHTHFKDINGNMTDVGKWVGGLANSVGMMIPAIIVTVATGGTALPAWLGSAVFYTGIFAKNMYDVHNNPLTAGSPSWLKMVNSTAKVVAEAAIEVALGKLMGGTISNSLMGIGSRLKTGGIKAFAKSIKTAGIRYLAKSAFQEGLEEFVQDFSTNLVDQFSALIMQGYGNSFTYTNADGDVVQGKRTDFSNTGVTFQTLVDSFFMGMLCSVLVSGGTIPFSAIKSGVANRKAKKNGTYNTDYGFGPGDIVIEVDGKPKKLRGFTKLAFSNILSEFGNALNDLSKNKFNTTKDIKKAKEVYTAMMALSEFYGSFTPERIKNCEMLLGKVVESNEKLALLKNNSADFATFRDEYLKDKENAALDETADFSNEVRDTENKINDDIDNMRKTYRKNIQDIENTQHEKVTTIENEYTEAIESADNTFADTIEDIRMGREITKKKLKRVYSTILTKGTVNRISKEYKKEYKKAYKLREKQYEEANKNRLEAYKSSGKNQSEEIKKARSEIRENYNKITSEARKNFREKYPGFGFEDGYEYLTYREEVYNLLSENNTEVENYIRDKYKEQKIDAKLAYISVLVDDFNEMTGTISERFKKPVEVSVADNAEKLQEAGVTEFEAAVEGDAIKVDGAKIAKEVEEKYYSSEKTKTTAKTEGEKTKTTTKTEGEKTTTKTTAKTEGEKTKTEAGKTETGETKTSTKTESDETKEPTNVYSNTVEIHYNTNSKQLGPKAQDTLKALAADFDWIIITNGNDIVVDESHMANQETPILDDEGNVIGKKKIVYVPSNWLRNFDKGNILKDIDKSCIVEYCVTMYKTMDIGVKGTSFFEALRDAYAKMKDWKVTDGMSDFELVNTLLHQPFFFEYFILSKTDNEPNIVKYKGQIQLLFRMIDEGMRNSAWYNQKFKSGKISSVRQGRINKYILQIRKNIQEPLMKAILNFNIDKILPDFKHIFDEAQWNLLDAYFTQKKTHQEYIANGTQTSAYYATRKEVIDYYKQRGNEYVADFLRRKKNDAYERLTESAILRLSTNRDIKTHALSRSTILSNIDNINNVRKKYTALLSCLFFILQNEGATASLADFSNSLANIEFTANDDSMYKVLESMLKLLINVNIPHVSVDARAMLERLKLNNDVRALSVDLIEMDMLSEIENYIKKLRNSLNTVDRRSVMLLPPQLYQFSPEDAIAIDEIYKEFEKEFGARPEDIFNYVYDAHNRATILNGNQVDEPHPSIKWKEYVEDYIASNNIQYDMYQFHLLDAHVCRDWFEKRLPNKFVCMIMWKNDEQIFTNEASSIPTIRVLKKVVYTDMIKKNVSISVLIDMLRNGVVLESRDIFDFGDVDFNIPIHYNPKEVTAFYEFHNHRENNYINMNIEKYSDEVSFINTLIHELNHAILSELGQAPPTSISSIRNRLDDKFTDRNNIANFFIEKHGELFAALLTDYYPILVDGYADIFKDIYTVEYSKIVDKLIKIYGIDAVDSIDVFRLVEACKSVIYHMMYYLSEVELSADMNEHNKGYVINGYVASTRNDKSSVINIIGPDGRVIGDLGAGDSFNFDDVFSYSPYSPDALPPSRKKLSTDFYKKEDYATQLVKLLGIRKHNEGVSNKFNYKLNNLHSDYSLCRNIIDMGLPLTTRGLAGINDIIKNPALYLADNIKEEIGLTDEMLKTMRQDRLEGYVYNKLKEYFEDLDIGVSIDTGSRGYSSTSERVYKFVSTYSFDDTLSKEMLEKRKNDKDEDLSVDNMPDTAKDVPVIKELGDFYDKKKLAELGIPANIPVIIHQNFTNQTVTNGRYGAIYISLKAEKMTNGRFINRLNHEFRHICQLFSNLELGFTTDFKVPQSMIDDIEKHAPELYKNVDLMMMAAANQGVELSKANLKLAKEYITRIFVYYMVNGELEAYGFLAKDLFIKPGYVKRDANKYFVYMPWYIDNDRSSMHVVEGMAMRESEEGIDTSKLNIKSAEEIKDTFNVEEQVKAKRLELIQGEMDKNDEYKDTFVKYRNHTLEELEEIYEEAVAMGDTSLNEKINNVREDSTYGDKKPLTKKELRHLGYVIGVRRDIEEQLDNYRDSISTKETSEERTPEESTFDREARKKELLLIALKNGEITPQFAQLSGKQFRALFEKAKAENNVKLLDKLRKVSALYKSIKETLDKEETEAKKPKSEKTKKEKSEKTKKEKSEKTKEEKSEKTKEEKSNEETPKTEREIIIDNLAQKKFDGYRELERKKYKSLTDKTPEQIDKMIDNASEDTERCRARKTKLIEYRDFLTKIQEQIKSYVVDLQKKSDEELRQIRDADLVRYATGKTTEVVKNELLAAYINDEASSIEDKDVRHYVVMKKPLNAIKSATVSSNKYTDAEKKRKIGIIDKAITLRNELLEKGREYMKVLNKKTPEELILLYKSVQKGYTFGAELPSVADEDLRKDLFKDRVYLRKTEHKEDNLKYFFKDYDQVLMRPELISLVEETTGIEDTLSPSFMELIYNGTLNTDTLFRWFRYTSSKEINQATFDLINKHVFKNTVIDNINELDKILGRVPLYWATAIYMREKGLGYEELMYTMDNVDEFIALVDRIERGNLGENLKDISMSASSFAREIANKATKFMSAKESLGNMAYEYARVFFMTYFNGSIASAFRGAHMVREVIKSIENQESRKLSLDSKIGGKKGDDKTQALGEKVEDKGQDIHQKLEDKESQQEMREVVQRIFNLTDKDKIEAEIIAMAESADAQKKDYYTMISELVRENIRQNLIIILDDYTEYLPDYMSRDIIDKMRNILSGNTSFNIHDTSRFGRIFDEIMSEVKDMKSKKYINSIIDLLSDAISTNKAKVSTEFLSMSENVIREKYRALEFAEVVGTDVPNEFVSTSKESVAMAKSNLSHKRKNIVSVIKARGRELVKWLNAGVVKYKDLGERVQNLVEETGKKGVDGKPTYRLKPEAYSVGRGAVAIKNVERTDVKGGILYEPIRDLSNDELREQRRHDTGEIYENEYALWSWSVEMRKNLQIARNETKRAVRTREIIQGRVEAKNNFRNIVSEIANESVKNAKHKVEIKINSRNRKFERTDTPTVFTIGSKVEMPEILKNVFGVSFNHFADTRVQFASTDENGNVYKNKKIKKEVIDENGNTIIKEYTQPDDEFEAKLKHEVKNWDAFYEALWYEDESGSHHYLRDLTREQVDRILEFYESGITVSFGSPVGKFNAFTVFILGYMASVAKQDPGRWYLTNEEAADIIDKYQTFASAQGSGLNAVNQMQKVLNPYRRIEQRYFEEFDIEASETEEMFKAAETLRAAKTKQEKETGIEKLEAEIKRVENLMLDRWLNRLDKTFRKTKEATIENLEKEITKLKNMNEDAYSRSNFKYSSKDAAITEYEKQLAFIRGLNNADFIKIRKAADDRNRGRTGSKFRGIRYIAMLSSPFTSLRNLISNVNLTVLNKLADKIGSGLFSKIPYRKDLGQVNLHGVKVQKSTLDFIAENFFLKGNIFETSKFLKDTMFEDLFKYGSSRYDLENSAAVKKGRKTDERQLLTQLICSSMENKFAARNRWDTKTMENVQAFVDFMINDRAFIQYATKNYFAKMLQLKIDAGEIDITQDAYSTAIMSEFAEAIVMAQFDYMHKPNAFSRIMAFLAKTSPKTQEALQVLFPFIGAGFNWFVEILKFTPVGLIGAISRWATLEKQVERVETRRANGEKIPDSRFTEYLIRRDFGKGVLGLIGSIAGVFLFLFGVIRLDEEDEKMYVYLNEGVKVDITPIFGTSSILIGASIAQAFSNIGDGKAFEKSLGIVADTLMEGFFFYDTLEDFSYQDNGWGRSQHIFESWLKSFVPQAWQLMVRFTNDKKIKYSASFIGMWERWLNSFVPCQPFGEREINIYTGEEQTKYAIPVWGELLKSGILGAKVYAHNVTDAELLVRECGITFNQREGVITINGKEYTIDKREVNKFFGELNSKTIMELTTQKHYVRMTDGTYKTLHWNQLSKEQKQNVLKKTVNKNADYAKVYVWTNSGHKYYASDTDFVKLRQLGITKNVYRGGKGFVV